MKKLFAIMLAAAMVAAMFTGCQSSASGGKIKIGMSGPLTGDAAEYGIAVKAGMEIAIEEINAKGGLQFEMNAQDDQAIGEKAESAYNNLMDWGMQIFAGTVTSGAGLSVAPKAAQDGIFMFTPSGSAVDLVKAGKNVYQMCFTDPNQGASAAELMKLKNLGSKIAVIYDSSDEYSTGIFEGFKEKAQELGLNIVKETSFTSDTNADLSTQVTQCKDAGADLVFLPIYYTVASNILISANTMGYKPTFFGCDGMDGILAVDGFDTSIAEGLILMTPFDANADDAATKSFVEKYKAKTGAVPNQFAADAYDVIYALYKACTDAGVTASTSYKDMCTALQAQFASMKFDGLTGSGMSWDENGMISKTPAAVKIQGGIYVPLS